MGEKIGDLSVLKKPEFKLWERAAYPIVSKILGNRVEDLSEIQEEPGALDEFADKYKQGAFGFVAEGPHLAHHDPIAVMRRLRYLRRKSGASRYLIPASVTLINGGQEKPNSLYKILLPYLDGNHAEFVAVATANDYKREMDKSTDPDETKKRLDAINFTAVRRMSNSRRENEIVLMLPEGSVQAGRKDLNGNIFGMQRVRDTAFSGILGKNVGEIPRNAPDFVGLPVGVWGTEKVFDPTTYRINPEVMKELKRLNLFRPSRIFSYAVIGQTFGKDEYRSYLEEQGRLPRSASNKALAEFMRDYQGIFFDFLMGERIAPLVPPEYQGVYRKPDLALAR